MRTTHPFPVPDHQPQPARPTQGDDLAARLAAETATNTQLQRWLAQSTQRLQKLMQEAGEATHG